MKITIFSGAGMSAESGINTFRNSDGLWEKHNIQEIATPQAWKSNPNLVTEFYNERRRRIIEVNPNNAHFAIAQLEEQFEVSVITQNIDDLHERAGSSNVLHLHGNIRYAKSSGPNQEKEFFKIDGWKLTAEDLCPEGYRLRPHVVWFGEEVPAYQQAIPIIESADVLIIVGSSLQVYPAAGLIHFAKNARLKFVIDPKADSLGITDEFKLVNKGAVDGIKEVIEILTQLKE